MRQLRAALALLVAAPAAAQLAPDRLAAVAAHPAPDARLPAALAFTTLAGQRTTLGIVAAGRPLALIFADYTCRNVCAPGIVITAHALEQSGLRPDAYRLAVIGLDAKDGAADARAMAAKLAGMPHAAAATTFLLGDARSTPAAARALGYTYAYDAGHDQFAHDASAYVFAANGHLDAVLPELAVTPAAMAAALTGPATGQGFVERVAHLCYGFAAAHGRFARPVALSLQALSAALLLMLGAFCLKRRRAA